MSEPIEPTPICDEHADTATKWYNEALETKTFPAIVVPVEIAQKLERYLATLRNANRDALRVAGELAAYAENNPCTACDGRDDKCDHCANIETALAQYRALTDGAEGVEGNL